MKITLNGTTHAVSWAYELDPAKVVDFLSNTKVVAYSRPQKFGALTFCTIRRWKGGAEGKNNWETVAEGVSPCRYADFQLIGNKPMFDRYSGRKHALNNALKGMSKAERREFWNQFNAVWPPAAYKTTRSRKALQIHFA